MNKPLIKEQMLLSFDQFQSYISKNLNLYLTNTYTMSVFEGELYNILRRNMREIVIGTSGFCLSAKNIKLTMGFDGIITSLQFSLSYGSSYTTDSKNQLIVLNDLLKELKPDWSSIQFKANLGNIITEISNFK